MEVSRVLDLARCMGFEGGGEVLGVHAGAVIGDGDELAASVFDGHCDGRRARIDTVLHQLVVVDVWSNDRVLMLQVSPRLKTFESFRIEREGRESIPQKTVFLL